MDRVLRPLPAERLTNLEGWAMLSQSMGYVYRPATLDGIRSVLDTARETGHSIVPRGNGFSYGDTALNAENIVLDLSRLQRVLEWDPVRGIIRVEPGVTVGQLWRYVLEDGWWPAVVPGTMYPTLGGCASTNVHGKNNWRVGSLGEHILSADLMLASGEVITCSPVRHPDLFHSSIGGLGMLGSFVSLTIQLEMVDSGLLRIEERAAATLDEMFLLFAEWEPSADHLIGWIDGYAQGPSLGRGLVHAAFAVHDDSESCRTLHPAAQDLPDAIGSFLPRSALWRIMKLATNDLGVRALNQTRYSLGAGRSGRSSLVPHAQFHFILDYVPNWKWAFRPGGIIQYQVFLPAGQARNVFGALLEESRRASMVPSLAVFKRHRRDPFLLSYNTDGYSLALDYHVARQSLARVEAVLSDFTHRLVLPAGGRFYPAKDALLTHDDMRQSFTSEAMDEFLTIKRRVDPDELFQSDLYRRAFCSHPIT